MNNRTITHTIGMQSRNRSSAGAFLTLALVICLGVLASPALATTYKVGPAKADIGDTAVHTLCLNGLDPRDCQDGLVRTRDDAITGDRIEQWTVEITNTSKTDTWKDFHVSLVWKDNGLGGAYLSAGSDCDPLRDVRLLPAKDPHPQSLTCLKNIRNALLPDKYVAPGEKLKLTVTVFPFAKDRGIVATKYHLTVRASTDGKVPSDMTISNILREVSEPVVIGQPFPVSGEITNADDISHIVYFKSYGVNSWISGTPAPFVVGPGESVPYTLQVTAQQDGWVAVSVIAWSEVSVESRGARGTVFVQARPAN